MKKLLQGLTVSALMLAGLAVSASAQSSVASTKVKVGFDFTVGNKQLPAGEYRIKAVNDGPGRLLRVESLDGKATAIISGIKSSNRGSLKADQVKFNRYGDQYFLSTVRFGNEPTVHQVVRSRSERKAEDQATRTARSEQKSVTIPTTGQ
ncbi:MAG TPA: hypothetical protein VGB07_30860 [Blastocatellia bacterium]